MLVACRQAGLSALEAYYAGVVALTQSGTPASDRPDLPHAHDLPYRVRPPRWHSPTARTQSQRQVSPFAPIRRRHRKLKSHRRLRDRPQRVERAADLGRGPPSRSAFRPARSGRDMVRRHPAAGRDRREGAALTGFVAHKLISGWRLEGARKSPGL
jgi:hypothetical protein